MTPHQAIALGAVAGLVLVAVVAYWRWRSAQRRRTQRNARMERAVRRAPPPLPNLRVPVPPVPTSADPWGDDEPTVFREPRGKR